LGISLHNPFFEKEIREIFDKEITKYEISKSEKDPNNIFACQNETENKINDKNFCPFNWLFSFKI
jgi:hypothetical protein